ncbi:MAG TPA: DUF1015 domain-containing protein [bacterium]|nr:DUF1015 domain-containing protein [bacterium]HPQ19795.1 DUF1015 domain-containing protein [bacterium]
MAVIKKFRGFRFNKNIVDLSKAMAPPYDVFEYGDETDKKLKSYQYNIAHISKPDGEGDSKYENAAKILNNFIKNNIIVQDDKEYFYIYQQTVNNISRTGIISATKLDDTYTIIKRHEKTKDGPKVDRLKLTQTTGFNIGLIFTVFQDKNLEITNLIKNEISKKEPEFDFYFPENINNKLWLIENNVLSDLLKDKPLYIADGHHRYQTMINYRDILRQKYGTTKNDNKPYEYAMIFNVPDANLQILAYNRVIKNISEDKFENFIEKLKVNFYVIHLKFDNVYVPEMKNEFGMYYKGKNYKLVPKEKILMTTDSVEQLDVSILQNYILNPILGINEDMLKSGKYITYPKGEDDVNVIKKLVDEQNHQVGFSLYPTSIKELITVADENKIMPQKSTYFYPKLLTGMVLNKVD